jgi:hypothetical protein
LGATFFEVASLFAGVHVGRDFHAQADFFKFRFDPVHIFIWLIAKTTITGSRRFSRRNLAGRAVLCPPRMSKTAPMEWRALPEIFSFGFWRLLLACFHAHAIFGFSADFGQHAKPDRI